MSLTPPFAGPALGLEIHKLALGWAGGCPLLLSLEVLCFPLSAVPLSFSQSVSWMDCLLKEGEGQGRELGWKGHGEGLAEPGPGFCLIIAATFALRVKLACSRPLGVLVSRTLTHRTL